MKRIWLLLVIVSSSLLSGCGLYVPQLVDVPLIEEKHDLRVDLGVSPNVNNLGGQLSASYGLTEHIAIQGHYALAKNSSTAQGAVGWFKKFDKSVLEVYAGYGYGRGYNDVRPFENDICGVPDFYHAAFAQVDYGWNNLSNSHIDLAFALKSGVVIGDVTYPVFEDPDWFQVESQEVRFLMQPTAVVRFGWEHFKFNIKVTYCLVAPSTHLMGDSWENRIAVSFGVNFHF